MLRSVWRLCGHVSVQTSLPALHHQAAAVLTEYEAFVSILKEEERGTIREDERVQRGSTQMTNER